MSLHNKHILIAPVEIAGYYTNLHKGLKSLGVKCDYVTFDHHPFGYRGESLNPYLICLAKRCKRSKFNQIMNPLLSIFQRLAFEFLIGLWGIYAIFKYDIFIFGFGRSLLRWNIDLPILKILRKKTISVLGHGSEARPAFIDGSYQTKEGLHTSVEFIQKRTKAISKVVKFHQKYCNIVLGTPFSTTQYAHTSFINMFVIGIPFQINNIDLRKHNENPLSLISQRPVRILHSPSHPAAKGTPIINKAIENLRKRGFNIEFITVTDRLYSDVLNEIQYCDFVVDQVYSDTPMAGFATEAAWFGKPAVVGGYDFDYLKKFVPEEMWPPSKLCTPSQIEHAIEELIVNREERLKLGEEAEKFVQEKWSAKEIARRYLKLIEEDIPNDWWLDPKLVNYVYGAVQSCERSKEIIRQMVKRFGVRSLCLSHRPDLEATFLEFSGIDSL